MTVSIAYTPQIWVENSVEFLPETINLSFMIVTYLAIALAVFIIAHSYQIHNGTKYTSIRFQTEVAALSALCASILILVCVSTPNPVNAAVMFDFFGNGLLNLTILLCDSYMFYYRLSAIIKLPKWKRISFHCYIWAFIVFPWFPTYNIIPIFFNTNDDTFTKSYYISATFVSATILLYNFVVTFEFTKILLSIYLPGMARSVKIAAINNSPVTEMPPSLHKIKVVAIKSIGHCLTSCSGVFCFTLVPVYGPTIQTVILIVGMHFWFNVKKTKHAWFVDFCLFKSSIFPESFFDSHSMDGDRHIGQVVPVPPAPPAFVVPNLEKDKEREREEREREERERHIDKEIKENEIKRRSRGNDLRIDDNARNLRSGSMGGCKSQGNTRPAANARGMDEKEKEREKEKETGSRIGCDISSRSSSVRKKKKNAMMDSFNQLGSFFTASSKRINDSSGKMRNSHIDVSQKTKERDKKVDDFDKDRLYDSYKKEIGSMRGKDRERDEEKEKDRDKDRDKSKDRDRDKDKEVELALGQGYGPKSGLRLGLSIPDTDTTALQYLALQGTAPQGVGVKEEARENEKGNKNEDDDEDDDGYSRHESVGTFPTINDGVSSM